MRFCLKLYGLIIYLDIVLLKLLLWTGSCVAWRGEFGAYRLAKQNGQTTAMYHELDEVAN